MLRNKKISSLISLIIVFYIQIFLSCILGMFLYALLYTIYFYFIYSELLILELLPDWRGIKIVLELSAIGALSSSPFFWFFMDVDRYNFIERLFKSKNK